MGIQLFQLFGYKHIVKIINTLRLEAAQSTLFQIKFIVFRNLS
jgi:hypothetical protein